MGRLRLYLITALAFLLEVLVLLWFPVAGVRPRVLPPLVCLVGVEQGPDRGAECGFFGGILCYLAGATPWQMALLALLGGCPGSFSTKPVPFGESGSPVWPRWRGWRSCWCWGTAWPGPLYSRGCALPGRSSSCLRPASPWLCS